MNISGRTGKFVGFCPSCFLALATFNQRDDKKYKCERCGKLSEKQMLSTSHPEIRGTALEAWK